MTLYSAYCCRSLQGLDNIASDGAAGFQTLGKIVDDLGENGQDKVWCVATKQKLQEGKQYLKTDYRVHCNEDNSPCKDHCRPFALSDPEDAAFQANCDHVQHLSCSKCEDLKHVLDEVKEQVQASSASVHNKEYQDDVLYDLERAEADILQWKAHVLRSVNQDKAKHDIVRNLDAASVLVVIDWAMKFLQMKYREKQSDWFGKRGISWHVSTVVSKPQNEVQVETYAHIFDCCQQDWFAVCSIFEDLLRNVSASKPLVRCVFLRSDEAGCYHNNALMSSLQDVGRRVGILVKRYNFSEPANGKELCDRILCPMKNSIRRYCDEGHDRLCLRHAHCPS